MEPLRFGIIGGGSIAKAHVIALRALGSYFGVDGPAPEVAVIADVVPEAAVKAAAEYGVARWTADPSTVLADDSIDAVTIAVPNDQHESMAIAAADAGKHLLCEKPLAHSVASARRMVDAVIRAGVVHSVDLNYRSIPAVRYARRLISEGALGEIVGFRGAFLQDWGLDPSIPRSWKFEKARAGAGPMLSLGCHVIDLAHFLIGDITEVVGATTTKIEQRPLPRGRDTYAMVDADDVEMGPVDIEDAGSFLMRFDNGAMGSIDLSRISAGRKNHCFVEISGTRGAIVFDYENLNEIQLSTTDSPGNGFTRVIIGPEQDGGLVWTLGGLGVGFAETVVVHMRDFVKAIRVGESTAPNFVDGLRAQEVADSVFSSVASGSWTKVNRYTT